MKKLVTALVGAVLLVLMWSGGGGTSYAADNQVRLFLNRTELVPEVPPRIVNDLTLVPVRIISEELGAEVSWNQEKQQVTIKRDGALLQLAINNPVASVNGAAFKLETAPVLDSGTTLLPVRFVTENLGMDVQWDNLTRSVFLFDKSSSIPVSGGQSTEPPKAGASTPPAATATPSPAATPKPSPSASSSASIMPSSIPTPKPSGSSSPTLPGSTIAPGATPGTSPSAGPDQVVSVIQSISFSDGRMTITGDRAVPQPVFTHLSNPSRLVIDLPGARLAQTVNGKAVGQVNELAIMAEFSEKIRFSQFQDQPPTVRIVVDLKQKIDYTLLEGRNPAELTIAMKGYTFLVVLDAGHGDGDPGAISKITGRKEKDFNLSMVLKIAKALENIPNLQVKLTRQDDTFVELNERADFANRLNADVFVSVHANSFNKATVSGTETYYSRDESRALADILHSRILPATGFNDRGVRKNDLRVTLRTVMPAVLCEIGYLSSPEEEAALFTEKLQLQTAEAIAAGIREYLQIP
jgi:N-acetylmuramoyl-L-alanine amidase